MGYYSLLRRTSFWNRWLKKKNPARAEQIYANNAARVTAVRPGKTGEVSQSNIVWSEKRGVPGVPSPLYYKGFLYSLSTAESFSVEKPRRES